MKIEEHISLKPLTTFGIGGKARYFSRAGSVAELEEAVVFAKKEKVPIFILGGGSNVLISDEGFAGLVIKMDILGIEFVPKKSGVVEVVAGAGEEWDYLVGLAVEKGLHGIENLSHIPGSVGAAPVQNIGAYGVEVKGTISFVEVFDIESGETRVLKNKGCQFSYRDSIFKGEKGKQLIVTKDGFELKSNGKVNISYRDLEAYFSKKKVDAPTLAEVRQAVVEIRCAKLPDWRVIGTAGSFFKNPIVTKRSFVALRKLYPELLSYPWSKGAVKLSLAWILDNVCNAKGFHVGKATVYKNQALVLVNEGGASAEEVKELASKLQALVKEKTGIMIEPEVQWVE